VGETEYLSEPNHGDGDGEGGVCDSNDNGWLHYLMLPTFSEKHILEKSSIVEKVCMGWMVLHESCNLVLDNINLHAFPSDWMFVYALPAANSPLSPNHAT
jgi:hypothetical protein